MSTVGGSSSSSWLGSHGHSSNTRTTGGGGTAVGINGSREPKSSNGSPRPIWNSGRVPTVNGSSSESHASTSTSTTSGSMPDIFSEREGGGRVRVGRDYQAVIPPLIRDKSLAQNEPEEAITIWCPTDKITQQQLTKYLDEAKAKFNYNEEQSSGLLYWHKYDIEKALLDLGNFTPQTEEWTIEDKVIFDQAFMFHEKQFTKIRSMLPDKSMSSIIRYYYIWKKAKAKPSTMDRRRLAAQSDSTNTSASGEQKTGNDRTNGPSTSSGSRSRAATVEVVDLDSEDEVTVIENGH